MAPLVKELESRPEIQSICCITAQHRQMLDDVLHLFDITPDYDLDIMEARQSLYTITSKCLLGMEEVFSQEKPDPGFSPRRHYHDLLWGLSRILSEDRSGPCRGWPTDLGPLFALPGGDEPDLGR